MLSDENRYRILKRLEDQPKISQRELAGELGVSVGKINYCINALVEKGLIKVSNFQNSPHKGRYIYLLTPKGIEAKAAITLSFLKSKLSEYEELRREIDELRQEVEQIKTSKK